MIWGRRVDGEQIEYRGGEVVVEEVMGEKQHAYTHIPRSNTFTGGGRRAHMKSCRLEKNGRQRKEGGVGKKKKICSILLFVMCFLSWEDALIVGKYAGRTAINSINTSFLFFNQTFYSRNIYKLYFYLIKAKVIFY